MSDLEFGAFYFDGRSSRAHPVRVRFDGRRLRVAGEGVSLEPLIEHCRVNPPLGQARRVIRLPEEGRLETDDRQAVERLEARLGLNRGLTWVHRLEAQWRLVVACMAGLVLFSWAFVRWGLPFLAAQAAFATPVAVTEPISRQALKVLDEQFLEPSKLPPARRRELEAAFARVAGDVGGGYSYRLEFRSSPKLGPNAFALPSGVVVFTDGLVHLAQDDRELVGVMAHEVGHVIHRHSLRQLYQGLGVFVMVSILVGDVTSVTSLGASLPAVLVNNGYSRGFELEADRTAGAYLLRHYGTTRPLQNVLHRLAQAHDASLPDLLSTHPATPERMERLRRMEEGTGNGKR
ncbi:Metalloprotease LoiP [Calidithermus terrae]|uniref:Metalloprotease LoiP n=2 Tax=Calidithermus terrae TaxID=1408545 RepID=A0A399EQH3_9DEIN|nr:Metalloprotease LoiP [Calidithermus terrae]